MGDWPSHPVCGLHMEELGVAEGRFLFGADPRQRDPDSELLLYLHPDEVVALLSTAQGQPRGQTRAAPSSSWTTESMPLPSASMSSSGALGLDCTHPLVKNPPANAGDIRDMGSIPGSGKSPGGWQPTPVLLPEESHGQRSLAGYSP